MTPPIPGNAALALELSCRAGVLFLFGVRPSERFPLCRHGRMGRHWSSHVLYLLQLILHGVLLELLQLQKSQILREHKEHRKVYIIGKALLEALWDC